MCNLLFFGCSYLYCALVMHHGCETFCSLVVATCSAPLPGNGPFSFIRIIKGLIQEHPVVSLLFDTTSKKAYLSVIRRAHRWNPAKVENSSLWFWNCFLGCDKAPLWKMCFLLASTIPFFVALLFCRLCKLIELLGIFNFYRILLLETCARFLSFLPCIFIVIASFYRFSLVLSF